MDISLQERQEILRVCGSMTPEFMDGEDEQSLRLFQDRPPFYVSCLAATNTEELPGGGGHMTLRGCYVNSQEGFEPLMTAVLRHLADRCKEIVFFDVGAEYGLTSLITAALFERSHAHIFEMNPFTRRALQRNLALNRHLPATFSVNQLLLSDRNGHTDVVFRHYTAKPADATEGKKITDSKILITRLRNRLKHMVGIQGRGDFLRATFEEKTIDAYCEQKAVAPDVIKIDVEGSQYKILKGAVGTLQKHRPVLLIEFDAPGSANDIGRTNREILDLICGLGYRCAWGQHRLRKTDLVPIAPGTELDIEINSLAVFYHPDRAF